MCSALSGPQPRDPHDGASAPRVSRPALSRRVNGAVLAILLSCLAARVAVAEPGAEPPERKHVAATEDGTQIYRDGKVVLEAKEGRLFRVLSRKGDWLGVAWVADGETLTGWVSASKVAAPIPEIPKSPKVDRSVWTSPDAQHADKLKLQDLFLEACEGFAQITTGKAEAALALDSWNSLLYYVMANGRTENVEWSGALKALAQGHSCSDAYLYVSSRGLERYLEPPPHIEPVRKLAVALTKRARKKGSETAVELMKNLRQMGLKLVDTQPLSAVNLQLSMALLTIADMELEKVVKGSEDAELQTWARRTKEKDERWIRSVQQELSLGDSEETLIAKHYLRESSLSERVIKRFMDYAPAVAMNAATGIRRQAKRSVSEPRPASKPKPRPARRPSASSGGERSAKSFYRRASNYDFLSEMIADTAPEVPSREEEPEQEQEREQEQEPEPEIDDDTQMAEFFGKQEDELLKSLKSSSAKMRLRTAKGFLIASLTGEDSALFSRLMKPTSFLDREDRKRWDTACDEGLQEMAKTIQELAARRPAE